MSDECDKCNKECRDHGTMGLLVEQHKERIATVEKVMGDMGNDVAKMEGRLNSFIWVLGLVFGTILVVSFYGSLQMAKFKDIYMEDAIKRNKAVAEMSASINSLKETVKRLEK